MGTTFSTLSFSVVVAGTAAYVCYRYLAGAGSKPALPPPSKRKAQPSKPSKKKFEGSKQESEPDVTPLVVPFPKATNVTPSTSIPGAFEASDAAAVAPKTKKPKKKKGKKAGAGAGAMSAEATSEADSVAPTPTQKGKKKGGAVSGMTAASGAPDGEQWTRVEAKRKLKAASASAEEGTQETKDKARPTVNTAPTEPTTSDAGVTTSVTGTGTGSSSPVTERTTDEELAETFDVATPGVDAPKVKPAPGEEPVKGYSWDDYEGVDADADGEGEWGVVPSKKTRRTPATDEWTTVPTRSRTQSAAKNDASSTPSKKQRQNAAKRDAVKAGKAEAEAQRLATLARHKREVERARMEQMI